MRVAYLSPLPPVKSGIASYSEMLLPALARRVEVTVVVDQREWRDCGAAVLPIDEYRRTRERFDRVIYQLGNNLHHEFVYREAMDRPGVAVLHEVVLHHLVAEMTIARGDLAGYATAMRQNYGELGEAWAEARGDGFHVELANFLLPASSDLARRSSAVIVHNRYAADRLCDEGVNTPIRVIPHPFVPPPLDPAARDAMRSRLGYREEELVVGMFGFVTAAKRPEVVFEAFSRAAGSEPRLRLLIVGEPAPNIDLSALAARAGVPEDRWKAIGYAPDEEFDAWVQAVDRVISLRYPTAGETSGALLRVLWAGKPVAVNGYAQFAEIPADVATHIEMGAGEIANLAAFLLQQVDPARAARSRQWVEAHADVERSADAYVEVLRGVGLAKRSSAALHAFPIPLFPEIAAALRRIEPGEGDELVVIRLENRGDAPVAAAVYGSPGYRLLIKGFHDDEERFDRWVELPRDLGPGEVFDLSVSLPVVRSGAHRLRLYHALEGIPFAGREAFATLETGA